MAWARSNLNLGNLEVAAGGFQRVLLLEPSHAEAKWELEDLEIRLGRSLTGGMK
jgi:hypothetical protein